MNQIKIKTQFIEMIIFDLFLLNFLNYGCTKFHFCLELEHFLNFYLKIDNIQQSVTVIYTVFEICVLNFRSVDNFVVQFADVNDENMIEIYEEIFISL